MSRILVCGLCPVPGEKTEKNYGPGIRSWQFASSLMAAGHSVRLLAMRIEDAYGDRTAAESELLGGVEIRRLGMAEYLESDRVRWEISDWRPDLVVGATIYGSYALARTCPQVPFWADQFGHAMAEAQAKAARDGNNLVLPYFWRMVSHVVSNADRISVVSERQKWAAIGELGCLGRLSHENCGYEFVSVIPCAKLPEGGEVSAPEAVPLALPEGSWVVLWSGSFNVWSDVETLFGGVCLAMDANPRVRLVATGGPIPGHDDLTYASFQRLVSGSRHRERFHLLGWLPSSQVGACWATADIGVVTDLHMYEGELGSKNRIVQWMGFGLPVVYNRVGDIGDLLASERIGLLFARGDAGALADRLLWAARHPAELGEMAARAKAFAAARLSFSATTAELVAWAERPERAPDRRRAGTPAVNGDELNMENPRTRPRWLARVASNTSWGRLLRAAVRRARARRR